MVPIVKQVRGTALPESHIFWEITNSVRLALLLEASLKSRM